MLFRSLPGWACRAGPWRELHHGSMGIDHVALTIQAITGPWMGCIDHAGPHQRLPHRHGSRFPSARGVPSESGGRPPPRESSCALLVTCLSWLAGLAGGSGSVSVDCRPSVDLLIAPGGCRAGEHGAAGTTASGEHRRSLRLTQAGRLHQQSQQSHQSGEWPTQTRPDPHSDSPSHR